jgi:hypothetical protein
MHLNNVTVAEVEANGRLLVNKAADYLSEIEARKKTHHVQRLPFRRVLAGRYGISCIANVLVAVVFPSY